MKDSARRPGHARRTMKYWQIKRFWRWILKQVARSRESCFLRTNPPTLPGHPRPRRAGLKFKIAFIILTFQVFRPTTRPVVAYVCQIFILWIGSQDLLISMRMPQSPLPSIPTSTPHPPKKEPLGPWLTNDNKNNNVQKGVGRETGNRLKSTWKAARPMHRTYLKCRAEVSSRQLVNRPCPSDSHTNRNQLRTDWTGSLSGAETLKYLNPRGGSKNYQLGKMAKWVSILAAGAAVIEGHRPKGSIWNRVMLKLEGLHLKSLSVINKLRIQYFFTEE